MTKLLALSLLAGFALTLLACGCSPSASDLKKDGNVIKKGTETQAPPAPPPPPAVLPPPPKQ